MKIIDISVPNIHSLPSWPGSEEFKLSQIKSIEHGDECNLSTLSCDVHTGTHIDAPKHFLKNGDAIEKLSLDTLIGKATVVYLPDIFVVTADSFKSLKLSPETQRLLIRTKNSELWAKRITDFQKDYVALTDDAAQWIVEQNIKLIGIDYLSVECYESNSSVHQILLSAGVVIVEGLNLTNIQPGCYELICLPICLVGADGAPARAVLRRV